MSKIRLVKFDEEGQPIEREVELSAVDLMKCMAPVRFMGGGCKHYYTCSWRHDGVECAAKPTREAEAKKKQADEEDEDAIDGEPIAAEFRIKCACCDEVIQRDEHGDLWLHYGDTGTRLEGKEICDGCFDSDLDEALATVYYGRDEEPKRIGVCCNETEGDFSVHWRHTDAWRGYAVLESEAYIQVFEDAILSGHESEGMLKKLYDIVIAAFETKGIDYVKAFTRTSNVFSTGLDFWIKKDPVQILQAGLIIQRAKKRVKYDDPLYKTGILIPRDALERFQRLLPQHDVKTDDDLWKLVAERGSKIIRDVQNAAQKGATNGED